MTWTSVPFDLAEAGMLPVEAALARLALADNLGSFTFDCGDPGLAVVHGRDWFAVPPLDPAPVWLNVPSAAGWFQLTHQAAKQVGSTARVPKKLQEFLPAANLARDVTWALREGLGERPLKLLTSGTGTGPDGEQVPLVVAQCRDTIEPFADARLVETVLAAARARFGDEAADTACVDYKFWADLEHTSVSVVFPAVQTVILGTGVDEDAWCYGIQVHNSLTALKQTTVGGYLFRFDTTAGCLDVEHASGGFKRRNSTPEGAYAWTAEACRDVFTGVESAFNGVQALVKIPVIEDYHRVLRQLFRDNSVPKDEQLRIIAAIEDQPDTLTMYDLMNIGTECANLTEEVGWRTALTLQMFGGDIVHRGGGMCDGTLKNGCRRLLPDDWSPDEAA
jgi:hypothetical protein